VFPGLDSGHSGPPAGRFCFALPEGATIRGGGPRPTRCASRLLYWGLGALAGSRRTVADDLPHCPLASGHPAPPYCSPALQWPAIMPHACMHACMHADPGTALPPPHLPDSSTLTRALAPWTRGLITSVSTFRGLYLVRAGGIRACSRPHSENVETEFCILSILAPNSVSKVLTPKGLNVLGVTKPVLGSVT
jgi:hypothetical protein